VRGVVTVQSQGSVVAGLRFRHGYVSKAFHPAAASAFAQFGMQHRFPRSTGPDGGLDGVVATRTRLAQLRRATYNVVGKFTYLIGAEVGLEQEMLTEVSVDDEITNKPCCFTGSTLQCPRP